MTVGIDDSKFFLVDQWPGEPTNGQNPDGWVTPSATEDFPLGMKRLIYDDTNNGWATLCYLLYEKGTAAAVAVKGICGIDTTSMATAGNWNVVTNDGGESQLTGPVAIALSAMTDGQYGWFWVGGVCPVDTISGLDGIFGTDGSITAGSWMVLADSASVCKFHLATATDVANFSAFSMEADTTS
jgi:hypothetical protein